MKKLTKTSAHNQAIKDMAKCGNNTYYLKFDKYYRK